MRKTLCHYEKAVRDIYELFNMGIEIKPRNVFYDNSMVNGGFIFIDFVIPNFDRIRKRFLREYQNKELEYFENNGVVVGALMLDEQEYIEFNEQIEIILNEHINQILIGTCSNIRLDYCHVIDGLTKIGMHKAWQFHVLNPINSPDNFENNKVYNGHETLTNFVNNLLKQRLIEEFEKSYNPHVSDAIDLLQSERKRVNNKH